MSKATVSDSLQHEAAALNSSSEDTDDNIPLPVGGHEDNPSDSGTTSDDDEEAVNQPEVSTFIHIIIVMCIMYLMHFSNYS